MSPTNEQNLPSLEILDDEANAHRSSANSNNLFSSQAEWKIRDLLHQAQLRLSPMNKDRSLFEARLLLSHLLRWTPEEIIAKDDQSVSQEVREALEKLIERRLKAEPVAYILGHKEFYGLDFEVDPSVLIPRPETEGLVDGVLKWIRTKQISEGRILDLGTGSGCVAITLATQLGENFQVTGIEQSFLALQTAVKNSRRLGVTNVKFQLGNIFGQVLKGPWTAIVSNPPYIPTNALSSLQTDIRDFEPAGALDGGAEGISFHHRILAAWARQLGNPGLVAMETMGPEQVKRLEILADKKFITRTYSDGPHFFAEVIR